MHGGGCGDRTENLDADFFGISPCETERLDPQQLGLLLQTTWEVPEDTRQDPHAYGVVDGFHGVHALICSGVVNNDSGNGGCLGCSHSRTRQEELLPSTYRDAAYSAGEVGDVDARGAAGVLVDDPIELGALGAAMREGRRPDNTASGRAA
jgi:acyl transferase domain-containing protein